MLISYTDPDGNSQDIVADKITTIENVREDANGMFVFEISFDGGSTLTCAFESRSAAEVKRKEISDHLNI